LAGKGLSDNTRQAYRSDLALFNGKLFTLERNAFQICRRDAVTAKVELCWSFADETLTPERRYAQPYGLAEALVLDADGAWLGIDSNFGARADGEKRPVVYRFAAPAGRLERPAMSHPCFELTRRRGISAAPYQTMMRPA